MHNKKSKFVAENLAISPIKKTPQANAYEEGKVKKPYQIYLLFNFAKNV